MNRLRIGIALAVSVAGCGLALEGELVGGSSSSGGSSSGFDSTSSSSSGAPLGGSSGSSSSTSSSSSSGTSGTGSSSSSSSSSSSGAPPLDASPDGPVVPPPALGPITRLADEDRTTGSDGAIADNGVDDGVFEVEVTGPVRGMILVQLDDADDPTFTHWDTYVGEDDVPAGFKHSKGRTSYQLGAFAPDGTLLNDAAGRLRLPAGARTVHVYVNDADYFEADERYRMAIETDDGTVVWSPIYTVP